MEKLTEEQRQKTFNYLFDTTANETEVVEIDTPTSEEYKKAHSESLSSNQNSGAEYAEAYINLGQLYL